MALTKDRNTHSRDGELFNVPMAAAANVYAGGIVMLNATGYATPGAAATGQICAGRAEEHVDNSAGADGDLTITVRSGVFKFANSASTDEITAAEVGDDCYIVDDQTVAKTDGTSTRSVAGKVVGVDSDGVWVRMGL
jgi:hypothetical protein